MRFYPARRRKNEGIVSPLDRRYFNWAFSLVELLVVIGIIGLLAVLTVPAFNNVAGGYTLTQQGQLLKDQVNLARQLAISRNREVELRVISYQSQVSGNWALQIFETASSQEKAVPLTRAIKLADSVIINTSAGSPLLEDLESTNATVMPLGQQKYYSLRFRPNGRVKGGLSKQRDYLTLQLRNDSTNGPVNYLTLQINPMTGRTAIYRP